MGTFADQVEDLVKNPTSVLVAVSIILAVYIVVNSLLKYVKTPPGPWGLPLVGYAPFMTKQPHVKLAKLSEKYGNIMYINLVGQPIIHLNDYDAIREAFVESGDAFAGRPQDFSFFQWITDNLGVAQSEGPPWKEHRRFALHTLRDFGFGKLSLESRVTDIGQDVLKALEESKGEPRDVVDDISNASCNVICSLLFDKHYDREDPEFLATRAIIKETLGLFEGASVFLAAPLSKVLPITWLPGYTKVSGLKKSLHDMCRKHIKEHQDTFDQNNLRDYVDAYLDEVRRLKEEGKAEESTFSLERLTAISLNLFAAGTETITSTLYWAMRLMLVHQDVQKKVQAEIDHVIGKERHPSIVDRSKMPYTEATIAEIHRYATIIGFVPVHSNPEEATLSGFTIPKRSIIMANLYAVNRDSKHYINPEQFQPTRFLEPDGSLRKMDTLMPFSIGKRACLGEALARMEVFLFFTSILQKFNLEPTEGDDLSFPCGHSIFRRPESYKLRAKLRF